MTPDVYGFVKDSEAAMAIIGAGGQARFYMFGEAPQDVSKPYAVWTLNGGSPENLLAGVPNMDSVRIQVDAYALKAEVVRALAVALRDAFEPEGYVTSYNFEVREPDTRLYRFSFNVEFMVPRQVNI